MLYLVLYLLYFVFCFQFANVINPVVKFFFINIADDCEIHKTTSSILISFYSTYIMINYIICRLLHKTFLSKYRFTQKPIHQ